MAARAQAPDPADWRHVVKSTAGTGLSVGGIGLCVVEHRVKEMHHDHHADEH